MADFLKGLIDTARHEATGLGYEVNKLLVEGGTGRVANALRALFDSLESSSKTRDFRDRFIKYMVERSTVEEVEVLFREATQYLTRASRAVRGISPYSKDNLATYIVEQALPGIRNRLGAAS
ncbi:MAG: hypothetical protein HYU97_02185 [Deltaproteobacteria bacterium]|nr:hypothetical protein [Deltaproteobacteria bacterium]